jgi:hypothetical protein
VLRWRTTSRRSGTSPFVVDRRSRAQLNRGSPAGGKSCRIERNACIWPGRVVECYDGHGIDPRDEEAAVAIAFQLAAYVAFLQTVEAALSQLDCGLGCVLGAAGNFASKFATPSRAGFALVVVGAAAVAVGGSLGVPVAAAAFAGSAVINPSSGGVAGFAGAGVDVSVQLTMPLGFLGICTCSRLDRYLRHLCRHHGGRRHVSCERILRL